MSVPVATIALGLVVLPAFTFQDHLVLRAVQCLFSAVCLLIAGRRIRLVTTFSVFLAVVAVHLITPAGRVLARIVGFPLTLGALEVGLDKGLLIVGLVFISKLVIRADRFVQSEGVSLVGTVVYFFDRFMQRSDMGRNPGYTTREGGPCRRLSLGRLVTRIDELLISMYESDVASGAVKGQEPLAGTPRSAPSIGLWVFVAVHWALFGLGRLAAIPDLPALLP